MSTDLPPEAYTRETLQAAFDWLQTQPDVVRSAVHTPERLVSLFQKSQRLHDKDHPVSSKKFISDLKNLATSLDQFSGTPQSYNIPPQATSPAATIHPEPVEQAQTTHVLQEPVHQMRESSNRTTTQRVQKASIEFTTNTEESVTQAIDLSDAVDSLTEQRLEEVKRRFNLADKQQALRLLVSLGYEKFQKFD